MRVRAPAALAVTATCACAGGPALAAVADQSASPEGGSTQTTPLTRPLSTTTATTVSTATTIATQTATQTTTTPATTDVCLRQARRAVATSLGVGVGAVGTRAGEGTNGMPQCAYVVRHPRERGVPHTRAQLMVNVDSGPQASWRLMRTVVEASQLFGPAPPGWHAPIGLYGLGQYASWFINLHSLMCVNHTRTELLDVTVGWRHANRGEMIRLARATVEPYIHARAMAVPIPVSGY